MCLICHQDAGDKPFSRELLGNGWRENPHGAGFMFAADGKVIIRKPFHKLKKLVEAYEEDHAKYGKDSPFVVHFRWQTHGNDGVDNIHPHELADGKAGLAHNGVLGSFLPPWKSDLSDTAWFCRTVLMGRPAEQITDLPFCNAIAEMIGEHNKMVVMDHTGHVVIINPDAGEYANDKTRWFSNGDWEKKEWIAPADSGPVNRGMVFPDKGKLPAKYLPPAPGDGYFEEMYGQDDIAQLTPEERDELEDAYNAAYDQLLEQRWKGLASNTDWDKLDEDAWCAACDAMEKDNA